MRTSPNPNALTAGESIAAALSHAEAARFEQHLRPLVDEGRGIRRIAGAYLMATET
jgi:hypothetical protein